MFGNTGGLFTLVFLLILGIIVWGIIRTVLRAGEIDELRRAGTRVAATVTNIVRERVQASAGTPPNPATHTPGSMATYRDDWYIEAEWTDPHTGATYHFKSDRLDEFDARRYAAGEPITILIAPNDPSRYYVEIAR